MPRKSRILKEHILAAALELIKDEGFENFTARRIAEYLNASTQPIYKEFENMDDLKERLIDYAKDLIQMDVFMGRRENITLKEVCANYIRFAKKESTLFCALFMDRKHRYRFYMRMCADFN
ncbi:MAG: helix-turn-helix domain-containing protein [Alkalibacterium sp.]|nr:helix-turn-helix domain-containing protein [Alkalibacterium sp.]